MGDFQNTQAPQNKLKSFFKNKNGKYSLVKIIGLPILGFALIFIVLTLLTSLLSTTRNASSISGPGTLSITGLTPGVESGGSRTYNQEASHDSSSAEPVSYETTSYEVNIETSNAKNTCDKIEALRDEPGVIFKNTSRDKNSCSYTLMVKNGTAKETLVFLKQFNTKNITRETAREKKAATAITSKIVILKERREAISATLESAKKRYDELMELATRQADVSELNNAIRDKIRIIEDLTRKKIDINQEITQTLNEKQELFKKFTHTFFRVNAYEEVYFNWDNIGDTWQSATREAIREVNETLQAATLGLLTFLLKVVQILLYLVIIAFFLLFITKFGYRVVKSMWGK